MIRRTGSSTARRCGQLDEVVRGPSAEGVARAHVDDHETVSGCQPGVHQPRVDAGRRLGRLVHPDPVPDRIGRRRQGPSEMGEQVPLVRDRVAGTQVGRPVDDLRVHPGPALDRVADPARRPRQPGEERRAGSAVEIDDEVVALAAQRAAEREVGGEPAPAAHQRHDAHLVEAGVALDDRGRGGLDQVGDPRLGEGVADRGDRRRREHHVADQPQADEQDTHQVAAASRAATRSRRAGYNSGHDAPRDARRRRPARRSAAARRPIVGPTGRAAIGDSLLRVPARATPRITGQIAQALDAYRLASEADPASAAIPAEIATLNARANRSEEAAKAARHALELDQDNADAHWVLGTILAAAGRRRGRDRPTRDARQAGRRQGERRRGDRASRTGAAEAAARCHAGPDARTPVSRAARVGQGQRRPRAGRRARSRSCRSGLPALAGADWRRRPRSRRVVARRRQRQRAAASRAR